MKKIKHLMAWGEPGNGDKSSHSQNSGKNSGDRDPWSGGGDSPPDLDEIFNKIKHLFGGGKGSGRGPSGRAGGPANPFSSVGISLVLGAIVVVWFLSGFYIVDEGNRGVVLRFGHYINTAQPGPHWRPTFIDSVIMVEQDRNRTATIGYRKSGGRESQVKEEALMLTKDENIVDVRLAVQYRVSDSAKYIFANRSPEMALKEATESALREVVGRSSMDFVLTEGRADVASSVKSLTQKILDRYDTGLVITSVNMKGAQPPEQVQNAFHDAVKAREDLERQKNEAEAYANDIIPRARGNAARQIAEAKAYHDQVISKAEGEASRFKQIYKEYKAAPAVTRERLYIDAMESVMSNSGKVMVDVQGGNNLLYLPLDKLSGGAGQNSSDQKAAPRIQVLPVVPDSIQKRADNLRDKFRRDERSRGRER